MKPEFCARAVDGMDQASNQGVDEKKKKDDIKAWSGVKRATIYGTHQLCMDAVEANESTVAGRQKRGSEKQG